jgi:predicted amidohydrolase YtcJ
VTRRRLDADLVLCDGPVFGHPGVNAVAVRAGEIVALGRSAVRDLIGPRTQVESLRGGLLLPGFQDAHVHAVWGGLELTACDLSAAQSAPEYLSIIARFAAEHPDRTWITGGGWALDAFPGGRPDRMALDSVVADRGVCLLNQDLHGAWVNSVALAIAGITRDTPDPPGGRIERDWSGEPSGMLQESAVDLVSSLVPPPSPEDLAEALRRASSLLHSFGVTAWQDAIVGAALGRPDPYRTYVNAAVAGRLTARVRGALWWRRGTGLEQLEELCERRAQASTCGNFRATSVKIMVDGICENQSAALLSPYLDGCGAPNCDQDGARHRSATSGMTFVDEADLPSYVVALDAAGFQVHFHALGDRAVRMSLDAIEATRRTDAPADLTLVGGAGGHGHKERDAGRPGHGESVGGQAHSGRGHGQHALRGHGHGSHAHGDHGHGGHGQGGHSPGGRHHLAHVQLVDPADIPRFARLGATATIQALWAAHEPQMDELTIPFLGRRRARWQYPFASLHAAGARLAGGSDWPVTTADPLAAIHTAVNRVTPDSDSPPFLPEQRLDLTTALRAYTAGSAYVNGLDRTGEIRVGAWADLCVLDRDPFAAPLSEIAAARVVATYVGGVRVYPA